MFGFVSSAVQVFLWRRAIKNEEEKNVMSVEILLRSLFLGAFE